MAYLVLSDAPNNFTSTARNDTVNGMGGDDTLTASRFGTTLYGGDGLDVVNGAAGNDVIGGFYQSHDTMRGFAGNDSITSQVIEDLVYGGLGDDLITLSKFSDTQIVEGGDGTDTLMINDSAFDAIPVTLTFSTAGLTINGVTNRHMTGFENLHFLGSYGASMLTGGAGNDTLVANANDYSMFNAGRLVGGAGDDELKFFNATVGQVVQQVEGGIGNDTMFWQTFTNYYGAAFKFNMATRLLTFDDKKIVDFTGIENVTLIGLYGRSIDFKGGAGVDGINARFDQGTVYGGDGNDKLSVSASSYNPNGENLKVTSYGGNGDDSLNSFAHNAVLYGGVGDDTISLREVGNVAYGGAGDDRMTKISSASFLDGESSLDGGSGHDTAVIQYGSSSYWHSLDLAQATVTMVDGTVFTGFEAFDVQIGSGNDLVRASNSLAGAAENRVDGGSGDDLLYAGSNGAELMGGYGKDSLFGDAGNDRLLGSFSDDQLSGGAGADLLIGEAEVDRMTGGAGKDIFRYLAATDTGAAAGLRDVITDFSHADRDRIDLKLIDAKTGPRNDAFVFIGTAAFGNDKGELRYEKVDLAGTVNDTTLISADLNGDKTADFQIVLTGLITLVAEDFVL